MFAADGFRSTTVRDICGRAGANIAAVNYHFGGKDTLYREVLAHTFQHVISKYPFDLGQEDAKTPAERLRAFVRAFLLRVLDPDRPEWHRRLMARELSQPSAAMRDVIEKAIRKGFRLLREIVTEHLGRRADAESVELCIASIVGQCLFYARGGHMVSRMLRHVEFTVAGVDKLASHIAEFSLGGLARRRKR